MAKKTADNLNIKQDKNNYYTFIIDSFFIYIVFSVYLTKEFLEIK